MLSDQHRKTSAFFTSAWKDDISKLRDDEKNFMETIHSILRDFGRTMDEDSPAATVYEYGTTLDDIKKLMELYQKVFHIVSVTSGWKDER